MRLLLHGCRGRERGDPAGCGTNEQRRQVEEEKKRKNVPRPQRFKMVVCCVPICAWNVSNKRAKSCTEDAGGMEKVEEGEEGKLAELKIKSAPLSLPRFACSPNSRAQPATHGSPLGINPGYKSQKTDEMARWRLGITMAREPTRTVPSTARSP